MVSRSLNRRLLLLLLAAGGCRPETSSPPREGVAAVSRPAADSPAARPEAASTPSAGGPAANAVRGPQQVVREVNALRRDGRLPEMAEYVAEGHRDALVDMVQAVDEVVRANTALQQRLVALGYTGSAELFDRSQVANILGVFSRDIEAIEERIRGDTAVVTISVAGRLPLVEVRLVRRNRRWLIQPDEPIPGLAAELRNLGQALRQVALATTQREMSVDDIAREMNFWQQPVLQRIRTLVEQAGQHEPPKGASAE